MIASIHQPQFIPWAGYFYKIIKSDKFVLYDNVQFPRGKHFGNRNKVKTANGPVWLTVPVLGKSDLLAYDQIGVEASAVWRNKHSKTLELSYKRAPHSDKIIPQLVELYQRESWSSIAELDEAFLRICLKALHCDVPIVRCSTLECTSRGQRGVDAIIAILKEVGADSYISGQGEGSRRYVDAERFKEEGIELLSYHFDIPAYEQAHGEFVPDLSVVDLIANVGDDARTVIEQSGSLVGWISA